MEFTVKYATQYVKLHYNEALTNGEATISELQKEIEYLLKQDLITEDTYKEVSEWLKVKEAEQC